MQDGREAIHDDTITSAVSEAEVEQRQKTVKMLTPHQQLVYEIIEEPGELNPSVLYERYRERASDPKTEGMVRNCLAKLGRHNLIEAVGKNRGRVYRLRSK